MSANPGVPSVRGKGGASFDPGSLRVLLVEDSVDDAELLARELRRHGPPASICRVDTLAAFSSALAAEEWDVVLADFNLAGFTALDTLATLRATGKDLPFIIVSGSVGEEAAVRAMKAGAHDFFIKDRVTRLGAAIERERREAGMRREHREALEEREQLLAELRLAVKARDEFLSIASHELKTPLTPLELQLSSARDLARRADPGANAAGTLEKIGTKLDKCLGQVARLTMLVNSLLDVTRITSGHLTIVRADVDLAEIVRAIAERSREIAQRAGSTLVIAVPATLRGAWDPIALETAVGNLLANAIKFGAGKPIEITVSQQEGGARVSVADHGIGIPPEAQSRIFERFERAVPTQHYGGFGIGLWITRQIVEAHEGSVRVTSAPGAGSTFTIDLPFAGPAR